MKANNRIKQSINVSVAWNMKIYRKIRQLNPQIKRHVMLVSQIALILKPNNSQLEGYRAHITTLLALQNSTEDVTRIAEEIITFEQYMANYIGVEDSANIAELEGITALTKV